MYASRKILAASALTALMSLTLYADSSKISTRVLVYKHADPGSLGTYVALIQNEKIEAMDCEPAIEGATYSGNEQELEAYLRIRCTNGVHGPDLAGLSYFYQTESKRFIITAQFVDGKAHVGTTGAVMTGAATVVLDLRDVSTSLMTYAFIGHPEHRNPIIETNHNTLTNIADRILLRAPLSSQTEVITHP